MVVLAKIILMLFNPVTTKSDTPTFSPSIFVQSICWSIVESASCRHLLVNKKCLGLLLRVQKNSQNLWCTFWRYTLSSKLGIGGRTCQLEHLPVLWYVPEEKRQK